jgi:transcriptional regulator with XRE-family HTH domain
MSRDPIVDYVAIGRRLRIARAALNLSEEEAAEACEVTLRTYRRWESGSPIATHCEYQLINFAAGHDISLDWLLAGNGRYLGSHLTKNRWGKFAILPLSARR